MIYPTTTPYIGGLHSHPVGVRDSTYEQTNGRTNERLQDQGEDHRVSYAAGPVDGGEFVAWFDRPLTVSEARVCLARTRALLEKMQAEQEALARELDESGVTGFVAQSEWLIAHRAPLQVLAAEIKAAEDDGWRPSHKGLGAPKRSHKAREFEPWQLAIAMKVAQQKERDAA